MKSIFDKSTRDELIGRIRSLNENSRPQWGKMNMYQMLKHCTLWEDMALGKTQYKRAFVGRLFGKMALKAVMKDTPLRHNTPTLPEMIVKENGNIAAQKEEWIKRIEQYENFSNEAFVHPFFGNMTKEQLGIMAYKHSDHHLRQFSC